MPDVYIFSDARDAAEYERLQAIEAIFDRATCARLNEIGLAPGWRCLEVGAGAGSIARWMSQTVGDSGRVVAIDTDLRFLQEVRAPNLQILKGDICAAEGLESAPFDLIHARYLFIHLLNPQQALHRMWTCLKPGGAILVEEPDFSAARAVAGNKKDAEAFNKVNRAIERMFIDRGLDPALGARLPDLFRQRGLQSISTEVDASPAEGSSGVAKMMKMSAIHLRDKYLATGEATAEEIEGYCRFAEEATSKAVYYATVRVKAKKMNEGSI